MVVGNTLKGKFREEVNELKENIKFSKKTEDFGQIRTLENISLKKQIRFFTDLMHVLFIKQGNSETLGDKITSSRKTEEEVELAKDMITKLENEFPSDELFAAISGIKERVQDTGVLDFGDQEEFNIDDIMVAGDNDGDIEEDNAGNVDVVGEIRNVSIEEMVVDQSIRSIRVLLKENFSNSDFSLSDQIEIFSELLYIFKDLGISIVTAKNDDLAKDTFHYMARDIDNIPNNIGWDIINVLASFKSLLEGKFLDGGNFKSINATIEGANVDKDKDDYSNRNDKGSMSSPVDEIPNIGVQEGAFQNLSEREIAAMFGDDQFFETTEFAIPKVEREKINMEQYKLLEALYKQIGMPEDSLIVVMKEVDKVSEKDGVYLPKDPEFNAQATDLNAGEDRLEVYSTPLDVVYVNDIGSDFYSQVNLTLNNLEKFIISNLDRKKCFELGAGYFSNLKIIALKQFLIKEISFLKEIFNELANKNITIPFEEFSEKGEIIQIFAKYLNDKITLRYKNPDEYLKQEFGSKIDERMSAQFISYFEKLFISQDSFLEFLIGKARIKENKPQKLLKSTIFSLLKVIFKSMNYLKINKTFDDAVIHFFDEESFNIRNSLTVKTPVLSLKDELDDFRKIVAVKPNHVGEEDIYKDSDGVEIKFSYITLSHGLRKEVANIAKSSFNKKWLTEDRAKQIYYIDNFELLFSHFFDEFEKIRKMTNTREGVFNVAGEASGWYKKAINNIKYEFIKSIINKSSVTGLKFFVILEEDKTAAGEVTEGSSIGLATRIKVFFKNLN